MNSFYLRRSFKRRPLRHLSLLWVLMCAFMLPLVVSIYRDSMIYGYHLQKLDFSKGQAIHISGAQPEDVALLRGIDGLTEPYYEDRLIYLNFASEEAWNRYSEIGDQVELSNLIKSRLSQNGRDTSGVDVYFYSYQDVKGIATDLLELSSLKKMQILSLALLLFSGLIVQSAYRNHIAAFAPELRELAALGATKGQMIRMFLLELGILFPLAAAGAVGISYGVMRILYKQYLEQTLNTSIVARVFHMDPKNTAVQIGFYLLVCLGALGFSLLKKPGRKQVKAFKNSSSSLARLWTKRTRPPFVQCLLILVPLITAFVVLFNRYLGSYASYLQEAQSVKISIFAISGMKQEELDFVSSLSGIRRVEPIREFDNFYHLDEPGGNGLYGRLYRYQDYAPGAPDLEKDQFVANIPAEFESTEPFKIYSTSNYKGQIALTLVKRLTPESSIPGPVDIYISGALMDELEADAPIKRLNIFTTIDYASSLEDTLRSSLPATYLFDNSGSEDVAGAELQVGHLWLLSWIFCILMIAAVQIIWVQLSSYVRECTPMLRTVYLVGASQRQLSRLIPVWRAAVPAAVLPYLIAVPYTWVRTWLRVGRMGTFIVSAPLIGIYALIAALAALAFLLPVKCTLKELR